MEVLRQSATHILRPAVFARLLMLLMSLHSSAPSYPLTLSTTPLLNSRAPSVSQTFETRSPWPQPLIPPQASTSWEPPHAPPAQSAPLHPHTHSSSPTTSVPNSLCRSPLPSPVHASCSPPLPSPGPYPLSFSPYPLSGHPLTSRRVAVNCMSSFLLFLCVVERPSILRADSWTGTIIRRPDVMSGITPNRCG